MSETATVRKRTPPRVATTVQNKENLTPQRKFISEQRTSSPLTPVQHNLVSNIRHKLEKRLESKLVPVKNQPSEETTDQPELDETALHRNEDERKENLSPKAVPSNISPGLAMLRSTPAHKGLKVKRHILETKHQESRNKVDQLSVGGGVSLWPEMQNMRLTSSQLVHLILFNIFLIPTTIWIFYKVHGEVVFDLLTFTSRLQAFTGDRALYAHSDSRSFQEDVIKWHSDFSALMVDIHNRFDVPWGKASGSYKLCVFLYILGIATLLFFLADNVLAKNKLSPRRIQSWVSLLTITGLWTLLSLKLLVLAQILEQNVQDTIFSLNDSLGQAISTSHNTRVLESVLQYWRTCCLPPTSRGILRVMGIVAVQDVIAYLQYYCLPVLTALLSPVVKLVVSLKQIYAPTIKSGDIHTIE